MASSTIFWVFGMTQPGTEPRSPRPLVNTPIVRPMVQLEVKYVHIYCSKNRDKRDWDGFWDSRVTTKYLMDMPLISKGDNYLVYPHSNNICDTFQLFKQKYVDFFFNLTSHIHVTCQWRYNFTGEAFVLWVDYLYYKYG